MKKPFDGHSYGDASAKTAIIMMHGFGANSADLIGLAHEIDPNKQFAWYFPNAPFPLMWSGSFAWFPSDTAKQEQAINGDYFDKLDELYDPGIEQSLLLLKKIISDFHHQNWVFAGFSQGSMMALRLALEPEIQAKALILFSCALFGRPILQELLKNKEDRFPILQSHGTYDQVLTIDSALRLKNFLTESGHQVTWYSFNGGHEIDSGALSLAKQILAKLSADLLP